MGGEPLDRRISPGAKSGCDEMNSHSIFLVGLSPGRGRFGAIKQERPGRGSGQPEAYGVYLLALIKAHHHYSVNTPVLIVISCVDVRLGERKAYPDGRGAINLSYVEAFGKNAPRITFNPIQQTRLPFRCLHERNPDCQEYGERTEADVAARVRQLAQARNLL